MTDPHYHSLVNTLEHLIEQSHFTPSELREACILASMHYEMKYFKKYDMVDPEINRRIIDLPAKQ